MKPVREMEPLKSDLLHAIVEFKSLGFVGMPIYRLALGDFFLAPLNSTKGL